MAHSNFFGGSSIKLSSICSASTVLRRFSPEIDKPPSASSKKGTLIHECINDILMKVSNDVDAKYTPSVVQESKTYLEAARTALKDIRASKTRDHSGIIAPVFHSEVFMEHPQHRELCGTADLIVDYGSMAVVLDFKTGKVPVAAADNMQLQYYSLLAQLCGVIKKDAEVWGVIVQLVRPPGYTIAKIPPTQLSHTLPNIVDKIVDEITSNSTTANPGPHCVSMYCPARSFCPAKLNFDNVKGE